MPVFEPAWPPFHAELTSEGYRNQFNALQELIAAYVETLRTALVR